MGIEPTSEAWEASILPLNYARSLASLDYTQTFARSGRRPRSQQRSRYQCRTI
jgi:hypothetical protein